MSPQYDAITGGDTLRIPALQSPNYVAGSTGWIIKGDGTVEFNSGTFRGAVEIGTDPGQHIILANGATGDAVDIWNAGNQLVFKIDNTGTVFSQNPVSGQALEIVADKLLINALVSGANVAPSISATANSTSSLFVVDSGHGTVGATSSSATFFDSVAGGGKAFIQGNQAGVQGALMQRSGNSGNLFHFNNYSVTTDGSGTFTFTHGAGFTPTGGMWTVASLGDPIIGYFFSFTSTQATGRAFNGGSGANTTSATFNINGFLVG